MVLVGDRLQLRIVSGAGAGLVRAAPDEAARGRRVDELGNGALDRRELAAFRRGSRHGREKAARVGMARIAEYLLGRADLGDPAGVHDRDTVTDAPHQRQIVADVEDAGLPALLQARV